MAVSIPISDPYYATDDIYNNTLKVSLGDTSVWIKTGNAIRIEHEFRCLSVLGDRKIVPKIVGRTANGNGLILEDVGITSDKVFTQLPDDKRMEVFYDFVNKVMTALSFIHTHRISHNDIKSDQICMQMVDSERTYKVIDFDLATLRGVRAPHNNGGLIANRYRIPPERWDGDVSKYDTRVDIFMLGILFIELLIHGRHIRYVMEDRYGYVTKQIVTDLIGKQPLIDLSNVSEELSIYDGIFDAYRQTSEYNPKNEMWIEQIQEDSNLSHFLRSMLMVHPEKRPSIHQLYGIMAFLNPEKHSKD